MTAVHVAPAVPAEPTAPAVQNERAVMVHDQIEERGVTDPRVLEAMRAVPRYRFVPETLRDVAYGDHPLPIGHGQTISQPYIVALMTELLEPDADDKVLEIGTGSGYQAAVLSHLVRHVYTIEIVAPLAEEAKELLRELGYDDARIAALRESGALEVKRKS